jgi:hypothetical protein
VWESSATVLFVGICVNFVLVLVFSVINIIVIRRMMMIVNTQVSLQINLSAKIRSMRVVSPISIDNNLIVHDIVRLGSLDKLDSLCNTLAINIFKIFNILIVIYRDGNFIFVVLWVYRFLLKFLLGLLF